MAGNELLRDRIKQTRDYDALIKERSFGQRQDANHYTDNKATREQEAIRRVKERINVLFGERILTESKKDEFKLLMRDTINELLEQEFGIEMTLARRRAMTQSILDDILGFGPIQELLEDPEITEVMVSRWDKVYAERKGKLILVPEISFNNEDHLRAIIEKIVSP